MPPVGQGRRRGHIGATKNNRCIAAWFAKEFKGDSLVELFGTPSAQTLRTWANTRGFQNDRRWCDMEAVPGQGGRTPPLKGFSFELAHWHATRAAINPHQTCAGVLRAPVSHFMAPPPVSHEASDSCRR